MHAIIETTSTSHELINGVVVRPGAVGSLATVDRTVRLKDSSVSRTVKYYNHMDRTRRGKQRANRRRVFASAVSLAATDSATYFTGRPPKTYILPTLADEPSYPERA
ncbi:hypothetical protein MTO96_024157 [Rhipicephalus appendiculatus]